MADFQLSGNTVLSESSGNITWGTGAPIGAQVSYNYHLKNDIQEITNSSSNTFTEITFNTNSSTQIVAKGNNSLFEITASISFGITDGAFPAFILAHSADGTSFTDILGTSVGSATRSTFGGQYGEEGAEDNRLFNSTMTVVVSSSISAGNTFYYQVRGTNRGGGSSSLTLYINRSATTNDANRLTGVSSMTCREIIQ